MGWESALPKNLAVRRGGGTGSFPDCLTVSVTSNGGKEKKHLSIVIGIPATLLKKARWVIGDRVELLKDSDKDIFLLKRTVNGYMLSPGSTGKGQTAKMLGKNTMRSMSKMPLPIALKKQRMSTAPCESVTVEDEGILFEMPEGFI